MGLCDPQKGPFPVFTGISRVRKLRSGQKFHRLSVSWLYSCVKILKKVGHSSLEIWAFVIPKKAPFLCLQEYLKFGSLDLAKNVTDCRLLAIQLCEKFEESGTFESRDMGLCDPQKGPFPVFARISRVRKLRSGHKFHRSSDSWPYSCVKSLKKVGHSSFEIWAFVTPKKATFLCL